MAGKRKQEWFDDDSFWRSLYAFLFPKERFAAAAGQAAQIVALAKPRGKSALDLCCGPGRFSLALAKRGFRVTGVDRTKFLLGKARAKAKAARAKIEFVQADMRDFVRPDSFDLALSMFTSFGYFSDKGEDQRVLGNVFASLKPGGVFLMDLVGKEQLAKNLQPVGGSALADGTKVMEIRQIVGDWTRIRNEWTLIKKGRARSFKFELTVYSGQELKERLQRAGFAGVKLYGDLEGAPYGLDARRLIAVGRKPAARRSGHVAGER